MTISNLQGEAEKKFYVELCNDHDKNNIRLLRGIDITDITQFLSQSIRTACESVLEKVNGEVDGIVRDVTSVGFISKSEARQYLEQKIAELKK
jgi:hypothetical protein